MHALTVESEAMERALQSLTPQDRTEILSVGAAFHRLTLKKRLERAERKLQEFEARYHATLPQVEAAGLPDNADYTVHEDYVEWHYWSRTLEQTRKALETLAMFAPEPEPA
jgi:hypothetical protein